MLFTIKEAAEELNISDKALYKRISGDNFNDDYIEKIEGRTMLTPEGIDYLKSVVRRKRSQKNENDYDNGIIAKDIVEFSNCNSLGMSNIYTDTDIETIKMLRDQVEYLKSQLHEQSINYQEQLKIQAEMYQQNLKIQYDDIKAKETIILNMQEIMKSQDITNQKVLDYSQRNIDVDEKLDDIRKGMISRTERKSLKRKKKFLGLFD